MMGRKSKLTDIQKAEAIRRHSKGESIPDLAKEYGVGVQTMRDNISVRTVKIKELAKQIVEVEQKFSELPLSVQVTVRSLADDLKEISNNLASVAIAGTATAKRIGEAARRKAARLSDDELADSETMREFMTYGLAINAHAKTGMDILTMAAKPNALKSDEDSSKITRIERVIVGGTTIEQ